MNRNILYIAIVALIIVAIVVGYKVYQDQQSALSIKIGAAGITVSGS